MGNSGLLFLVDIASLSEKASIEELSDSYTYLIIRVQDMSTLFLCRDAGSSIGVGGSIMLLTLRNFAAARKAVKFMALLDSESEESRPL